MPFDKINLVTAVSRQENLPRIHRSIEAAISKSTLQTKWILVVDGPDVIWPQTEMAIKSGTIEVQKILYTGGRCPYGVAQKNLGMGAIEEGYYHCIDDDNLVHPGFFVGLERAMQEHPEARAFVFGQQRWDGVGNLIASPDRMEYGKIDNTMFAVHRDLIGGHRYDLEKSGREDFHFFSDLWVLHRDKFCFIRDTLAYYNYFKYWPVESNWEPTRQAIVQSSPTAPPPVMTQEARTPGLMKIALYSSKRDRCGISTYTTHLMDALRLLGHEVEYWGSQFPYDNAFSEVIRWRPDVFHFQHETSIMPPEHELVKYAGHLRTNGIRVAITLHTESPETIRIGRAAGAMIMHRPTADAPDANILPMPCTSVGVLPDKASLRRKFGFPEKAFIVSTVGFLIPWKDHPRLVESLTPWLHARNDVHIQVIGSEHFNEDLRGYAQNCRNDLQRIGAQFPGRIRHVDSYPSDLELVERLAASDLGYVWCPFDTGSSSAAAAQFTTARCPLVATDSSHYAHLGTGIVRAPKNNLSAFIETIKRVADDPRLLDELRANQEEMYRTRNYTEAAKKHIAVYNGGRI